MFHSLIQGIKNLVSWFPIIWKDRQFDEGYLFDMFRHKLTLMDEFWHSEDPYSTKQDEVAKQVRIAKLLADRICDRDYIGNALTDVRKKYGEKEMRLETDPETGWHTIHFEESEEERKAYWRAYHRSDYCEKQDIKYLFDLMAKKMQRWWD